jgi:hypothetical protein
VQDRNLPARTSSLIRRAFVATYIVTTGHSRSKNGVASVGYDPVVHADAQASLPSLHLSQICGSGPRHSSAVMAAMHLGGLHLGGLHRGTGADDGA